MTSTIIFPRTFAADLSYRIGTVLFSLVGVIGFAVAGSRNQTHSLFALVLPFLLFFAALLLTWTFQLTVDDTGLHQRSILGRRDASWDEVRRLDQSRAYSIYGTTDHELVWLSLVSTMAQEAIAEEAIRRANLRLSSKKAEYPLKRQWVK
jgi:hypothetical protein